MKTSDEIRRILTEELGFVNLDAYKRWVDSTRPTIVPSPARIELLSPDAVDCRAFWKVCEELFGLDPVCNLTVSPSVGRLTHEIENRMDANRLNLRFAKSFGITAFLDENAGERLKTLEIGPGFGALKNYIETNTRHTYTGIDVYPRLPGLIETTPDGLIPPEFVEAECGSFSYVVSSNVFQHLSARQRAKYFEDAAALLHGGGLFIFNTLVDTAKTPPHLRDADGNAWCDHYGQYTLMPRVADLYEKIAGMFSILYVTQRYDGIFNFVCQKPNDGAR